MLHWSSASSRSYQPFALLHILLLLTSPSNSFPCGSTFPTLAFHRSRPTSLTAATAAATIMDIPIDKLSNYANSYAAANGLQVETSSSKSSSKISSSYQCAPISLLPNAFPAKAFENAKTLALYFNILVDRIARDGEFLTETLAGGGSGGVVSKDEYTKKLLDLYTDIYMNDDNDHDGQVNFAKTADILGIHRSDYMLNPEQKTADGDGNGGIEYGCKQVELNTIAASFAGLAVNVAGLHRMLTQRFGDELKTWLDANQNAVMGEQYTSDANINVGVPQNPALVRLPNAMNVAHEQYKSRFTTTTTTATTGPVILFVVQEGETNTVDQRMLEFKLWDNHSIPVVRMSLTKAKTHLELDSETGALYILPEQDKKDSSTRTKQEVSVVYFRAGYAPTDFPDGYDGIEWQSRELIERSRATKCPNLGYHLAGTKKVQQELARPGVLERFFTKDEMDGEDKLVDVENMRGAFAGLYSLGDDAVQEDLNAVKEALSGEEGASRFVLKPQREGGGYNYYGNDLAKKIRENVEENDSSLKLGEDLAEFILMQRLFPPKQRAVLLRAGLVEGSGDSISELGCFGTIVQSHEGKTLHNEYSGFLLRTKFSNVDEGGVASGFATLSSPYLV